MEVPISEAKYLRKGEVEKDLHTHKKIAFSKELR